MIIRLISRIVSIADANKATRTFFLPTDPEKSWKVTGNDNNILSRLMAICKSLQVGRIYLHFSGVLPGIDSGTANPSIWTKNPPYIFSTMRNLPKTKCAKFRFCDVIYTQAAMKCNIFRKQLFLVPFQLPHPNQDRLQCFLEIKKCP